MIYGSDDNYNTSSNRFTLTVEANPEYSEWTQANQRILFKRRTQNI